MDARIWAILACLFVVTSAEILTEQSDTKLENYTESEEVPHNNTSNKTAFEFIQEANKNTGKWMTLNYS